MKYAINNNGTVVEYNTLPSTWENIINFPKSDEATQQEKGFFPVNEPTIGQYQRLENLIVSDFDDVNKEWNQRIYDYTTEEIQNEIKSQSESEKQSLMQVEIEKSVVAQAQTETDTQTILDKQALYPFWEEGLDVKVDEKYQAFDGTELKLYRVVQAHVTQANWTPPLTPALWTRVAFGDEILVWVQPTGAQDAYNIGAKVHFPTITDPIFESLINNNTWSPTAYPAGWTQL